MIPKNDYNLDNDKQVKDAIAYALSEIDKNGYAYFHYASYPWWNLEKLKYVAKQFVEQGYYANVVWLVNGRCQSVRIRKEPFSVNSRMEYSEPII